VKLVSRNAFGSYLTVFGDYYRKEKLLTSRKRETLYFLLESVVNL
jgi:hypothetical protein